MTDQPDQDVAIAAAVAAATKPLQDRIEELEGAKATETVETLQARVTALELERDEAKANQTVAEQARDAQTAYLTAEAESIAAKKAADDRKDERVAAVKALEVLPEAHVDDEADNYAALSDEEWATKLERLSDIKSSGGTGGVARPVVPHLPSVPHPSAIAGTPTPPATAAAVAAGAATPAMQTAFDGLRAERAKTPVSSTTKD